MAAHAPHAATAAHGAHKHHVCSVALFSNVFIALMVLTAITVVTAKYVHLGSFNMVLAMLIASVKGTLVMTFFMHLKWDTAMNQIAILSSFVFLALLFLFTLGDLSTRSKADYLNVREAPVNPNVDRWMSPLVTAVKGAHGTGGPAPGHGQASQPTTGK